MNHVTFVGSRDLRNRTRDLVDRVEAGEHITITVDGRPVAVIEPIRRCPRWVARRLFADRILASQADAGLTGDLKDLADESTDDLPLG